MGRRDERFIRALISGSTLKDAAAEAGLSEERARSFLESVASFAGSIGEVPQFGEPAVREVAPGDEGRAMPPVVKPLDELIIYTDGSSSGNPGPSGAGVVILTPEGVTVDEFGEHLGEQTNNVAEYRAVYMGLSKALEYGASKVTVRLDSELVARQLSGRYKVKDRKLIEQYLRVGELLSRLDDVRFEAIPREQNSRADALAQTAARRRS